MIIGHIDLLTASRVEGWVYSPEIPVRGRRVLAFIDGDCVGGGIVGVHRPDLAEAGFGDGQLGFGFGIYLEHPAPLGRLVIRFENSDFSLVGDGGRVVDRQESGQPKCTVAQKADHLNFMRMRGWIEDADVEIFSRLHRFGFYQQSVIAPDGGETTETLALESAERLLSLHFQAEALATPVRLSGLDELTVIAERLRKRFAGVEPVVALWSSTRMRLLAAEGSHTLLSTEQRHEAMRGATLHYFGGPVLMVLDLDCAFRLEPEPLPADTVVFTPRGQES